MSKLVVSYYRVPTEAERRAALQKIALVRQMLQRYHIYAGARELRGVPAGVFVIGIRCAVAADVAPWRR